MSDWYYYNENNAKVGPISTNEIRAFAKSGRITPETIIENVNGRSVVARQVKGLVFPRTAIASSDDDNPFTLSIPVTVANPSVNIPSTEFKTIPAKESGNFFDSCRRIFTLILLIAHIPITSRIWSWQSLTGLILLLVFVGTTTIFLCSTLLSASVSRNYKRLTCIVIALVVFGVVEPVACEITGLYTLDWRFLLSDFLNLQNDLFWM